MSDKTNGQEVYLDADPVELPENAFRELAADETYRPLMHPARSYREATPYSVALGLILAVIFSAAAAYLSLRVGQVFEAAIPIAIIAVGLSGALKKKDPGAGECHHPVERRRNKGVIVAGAILYSPRPLHPSSGHLSRRCSQLRRYSLSRSSAAFLVGTLFIPFRK